MGTPEKVAKALEEHGTRLQGQSKAEYDAAFPHLIALVNENFNKKSSAFIKMSANGSGTTDNGEEIQRSCSVSIENIYGVLV
jgi:hypothetical protein